LVLRGGSNGPNYAPLQVAAAGAALAKAKTNTRLLVDCSHDNSGKNHLKQPEVLAEIGEQLRAGSSHLLGVMIESNLVGGKQELTQDKSELCYGQSITDACVDFATTESMLDSFAHAATHVRQLASA
jgi:3-deoxy-7-phosphoheptulonate synthase